MGAAFSTIRREGTVGPTNRTSKKQPRRALQPRRGLDGALASAINARLAALHAPAPLSDLERLETLTRLASKIPNRRSRLLELMMALEEAHGIDRRKLAGVLVAIVRLYEDRRYESAWRAHAFSPEDRARLSRKVMNVVDELQSVIPTGTTLWQATNLFTALLREDGQWPSSTCEGLTVTKTGVGPEKRRGRGNPLRYLVTVSRQTLNAIGVTDPDVQHELLGLIGIQHGGGE
jgi:hypothetical protein